MQNNYRYNLKLIILVMIIVIIQLVSVGLVDSLGLSISLLISAITLIGGFLYLFYYFSPVNDIKKSLSELNNNIDKNINRSGKTNDLGNLQNLLCDVVDKYNNKIKWLVQLLDSIPFPISVTDMNMNWTFINKPALVIIGKTREELLNQKTQCCNWGADICNSERC